MKPYRRAAERWAARLAGWFILDRALKAAAVAHFFRQARRRPADRAESAASVSIIQPITRGVAALERNLASRLDQDYPAPIQHVWVLDRGDSASQAICRRLRAARPDQTITIVSIDPGSRFLVGT